MTARQAVGFQQYVADAERDPALVVGEAVVEYMSGIGARWELVRTIMNGNARIVAGRLWNLLPKPAITASARQNVNATPPRTERADWTR